MGVLDCAYAPLRLSGQPALTSAEREALKSRASGVTAPEVST